MTATAAQAFKAWCRFLTPTEGGLSLDPRDPGNWTSGKTGIGTLKGTKFGISAAAHPTIDIASLTLDQANSLRKSEYWNAIRGDEIHPSVAFVLAEAAYGSGPHTAIMELQKLLGVAQDGIFGPNTMAALKAMVEGKNPDAYGLDPLEEFLAQYSAARILFEAHLGALWTINQGGWSVRLFRGLVVARNLA